MLNGQDYELFARPWLRLRTNILKRKTALSFNNMQNGVSEQGIIILDDDYRWRPACWLIQPFSHIYEMVEEFILQCHQHGIVEHWQNILDTDKNEVIMDEPRKLTLEILSAGFILWLITVAISIIVFAGELIYCFCLKHKLMNNLNIIKLKFLKRFYMFKKRAAPRRMRVNMRLLLSRYKKKYKGKRIAKKLQVLKHGKHKCQKKK